MTIKEISSPSVPDDLIYSIWVDWWIYGILDPDPRIMEVKIGTARNVARKFINKNTHARIEYRTTQTACLSFMQLKIRGREAGCVVIWHVAYIKCIMLPPNRGFSMWEHVGHFKRDKPDPMI